MWETGWFACRFFDSGGLFAGAKAGENARAIRLAAKLLDSMPHSCQGVMRRFSGVVFHPFRGFIVLSHQ